MNKQKILNYALGPISAALISFISLPLITWFYSIEDVGRISMLQVISSLIILLFCLGLDQAYTRQFHEAEDKSRLFKLVFLPGFLLLLITFLSIYIIDNTALSRWLYAEESIYLTIISITCFVFVFCSRFLSLILRMQERALAYSMSQLLPKLFFLLFILLTVWLDFIQDFYNLITAHLLSVFTVFIVFAWNTRSDWLTAITKKININELRVLLHFGLPLVVGGLAVWGLNVVDKLFLRNFSTFSELGLYSVAASIAGVAVIFSGVFNTIWAPLVYKWASEKSVDFNVICEVSEHVLAAMFFIIVLSGLLSWVIPYVLPKDYLGVQFLIPICLFAPLLYTLSEVTSVGIAITKKSKYSMWASIIAMLVNLIGNYLLVPVLGATGAAFSTAFSFWLFYILRTEFSHKLWYKIPRTKSYLTTSCLLLVSVFNVTFLQGTNEFLLVWLILMFIGFAIFRRSVCMIYNECIKSFMK